MQPTINNSTFLSRLSKFKYLIIISLAIIILSFITYLIYKSYVNKKANKNSVIFGSVQETLMAGKEEEAITLLNKLAQSGTEGYKLLSYLQQSTLDINSKDYTKAIEVLKNINNLNVPPYYKDLANYIISSIRLDNEKDLTSLINDLQKNVTSSNAFYLSNLELLAVAHYTKKDYQKSIEYLDKIINEVKAPNAIKERAKSLKTLALAYVK